MEEVRQLVQEEGREARNLVTFHVAVESPARLSRKPPRSLGVTRRIPAAPATRLRSASAGRDKRSELRARYWALLFGDLQRAIGEIYNTVEVHENLNECQEVILVLENYTRDFKALGEWFRLKWEYDNTPPPQRPQSLAWEIRKTDFVRLEPRRTISVKTSPSVSGKNSPCLSGHTTPSGKNSPNLTGKASPASGKVSPRISAHTLSPKGNVEFFSNKITATKTAKVEARLSDIKEKDTKETCEEKSLKEQVLDTTSNIEIGKAKIYANVGPKPVVIKSLRHTEPNEDKKVELLEPAKATIAQLNNMENEFLSKNLTESLVKNENMQNNDTKQDSSTNNGEKSDGEVTVSPVKSDDNFADISNESSNKSDSGKLIQSPDSTEKSSTENIQGSAPQKFNDIEMIKDREKQNADIENELLKLNVLKPLDGVDHTNSELYFNKIEKDAVDNDGTEEPKSGIVDKLAIEPKQNHGIKDERKKDIEFKKPDPKTAEIKTISKPAYSQAAAKPKPVTTPKSEVKTPTRITTSLTRSKTVEEMRPTVNVKPLKQFTKKNQQSKCSYPFNLTTGRTSLFDTAPVNKGTASKKPLTKNIQMAAGDAKSMIVKPDPKDHKKSTPRPTSLKIPEKGDRKEMSNLSLGKVKDSEEYSSSDTIVTQIDMSRIESSESLKTLVSEDLQVIHDVSSSIEVLNLDSNKNDNDGWLTVKSKRVTRESKKQLKSHWANRFHQPSATTSLPTLNMLESPKQELNPALEDKKNTSNRAKSEQPENIQIAENLEQGVKKIEETVIDKSVFEKPRRPEKADRPDRIKPSSRTKSEVKVKTKDLSMIRQKSDVTGLRTRSARNKALNRKSDKAKDKEKREESQLIKNRLHSSLESLTTGLARSQESTEEAFDFDKWKEEFKINFKYEDEEDQLTDHNEILKTADPSEMSEIAEMTSLIEENERKISLALDFQTELDQRKLCEEEDLLNRQIMELQQGSDIDLDTETDDTETDAELVCCDSSSQPSQESLGSLAASLEDQYETQLEGMSWAERVDTLVVLEALVARDPGRAQQLHAKLSQGIKRRGSLQDALRRLQAKQARAEKQRFELQTERSKKIHLLLARVEEVKVAKNQLIDEKRFRMERRLQKAAENRDQHLKDRVRKAHDEEEKLREIAFIKQLQEQNKRHEFVEQCRAHTSRLREQRRDRLTRLEQKAAREAAVGARRLAIETARALHVQTLLVRSRERGARGETMREMKRQERGEQAREKAEGVKSRLSALAAAAELEADALRERIRDKQDASEQRLQRRLRAIRDRATTRTQTLSESQEQDDIEEQEAERLERERKEREKQKAIKKKARKLKQKLLTSTEFTPDFAGDNRQPFDCCDCFSFTGTNRIHKTLLQITNMIEPLIKEQINKHNGMDENRQNDDKQQHKKSNKKQKNITNGDTAVVEENGAEPKMKTKKKAAENCENPDDAVNVKIDIDNNNDSAKPVESSKKKKKKNKDLERAKLSKANSVCSSLSDMSKASCKSEKKGKIDIDSTIMERHLNELHRILDRVDKSSQDIITYEKSHALKVIGVLLSLADESEEFFSQITSRCLTAVVTLRSRICSGTMVGPLSDSAHLASILNKILDKEITDNSTIHLCRQLCDCLSVTFDSAVCSNPPYRPKARQHAHALVSYMCLSNCISKAGNVAAIRESVQTLLTVIADLCRPCDDDIGTERAAATLALRSALGTSLCGSRGELCALFVWGAGLDQCSQFVKAARTAHLLKLLAATHHEHLQESFGEGGWPLEFRAAVSRLLLQHAPNDKHAPSTGAGYHANKQRLDQQLSETMVLDLIELVGYVVVNNTQLQETILPGWNVVKVLCTLPANWLVSRPHSRALLPTLLALAQHAPTKDAIAAELSIQMLEDFYDSAEAQNIKLIQLIKQGREKNDKK